MATRKLYRCNRPTCLAKSKGQFWYPGAEKDPPKCPQCCLCTNDPNFGDMIQRLVVVHLDPPSEFRQRGWHVRACSPRTSIQAPVTALNQACYHAGTGIVMQVNCEACMQTEIYQAMMQAIDNEEPTETVKLTADTMAVLQNLKPLARLV